MRIKIPDSHYSFETDKYGKITVYRYNEDVTDSLKGMLTMNFVRDLVYAYEDLIKEKAEAKAEEPKEKERADADAMSSHPISKKQREMIERLEHCFHVEFYGNNAKEASDFIGKYYDRWKKGDYGTSRGYSSYEPEWER